MRPLLRGAILTRKHVRRPAGPASACAAIVEKLCLAAAVPIHVAVRLDRGFPPRWGDKLRKTYEMRAPQLRDSRGYARTRFEPALTGLHEVRSEEPGAHT